MVREWASCAKSKLIIENIFCMLNFHLKVVIVIMFINQLIKNKYNKID